MTGALLQVAIDWARAHTSLAGLALLIGGGVTITVIKERGKTARARLKYGQPATVQASELEKPFRVLDKSVPKLLDAPRPPEKARRDQEPADDVDEVPIFIEGVDRR
jgi:hypothetical protein